MASSTNQGSAIGLGAGQPALALALVAEHGISLDAAAVVVSVGAGVCLEAPPVVETDVAGFVGIQEADRADAGILTNPATEPPPLDCVEPDDEPTPDDAVVIDLGPVAEDAVAPGTGRLRLPVAPKAARLPVAPTTARLPVAPTEDCLAVPPMADTLAVPP